MQNNYNKRDCVGGLFFVLTKIFFNDTMMNITNQPLQEVEKLIDNETCSRIIQKHYREIFNYCFARLSYDHHSAEDCTQEVFVVFFSKHKKLEDSENLRIWLYRAADNVIKTYWRKRRFTEISLEESPEAMNMVGDESPDACESGESILNLLDSGERQIIEAYYDSDYGDRSAAAKKLGLTLPALYQRVHKIKNKLKSIKNDDKKD